MEPPLQPAPERLPQHHPTRGRWSRPGSGVWTGGILIIVGVYFLLRHLNLVPNLDWEVIWPVILILLGAYFVARRLR